MSMANFHSASELSRFGRPTRPPQRDSVADAPEDRIIRKICRNTQAKLLSHDELRDLSRFLCNKEDLCNHYLNVDFVTVNRLYHMIQVLQDKIDNDHVAQDTAMLEDIQYNITDIESEASQQFMKIGKEIKVRFLIVENVHKKQTFRRMMSPITVDNSLGTEFGTFRTQLAVGPWILEWSENGLCIPRRHHGVSAMTVSGATFAGRLGRIPFDIDDAISKISPVIIDWNLNKSYSDNECNCQHFVDELLKALGIPYLMDGSLAEYLTQMRTFGICKCEMVITQEFAKDLKLKEEQKQFMSHKELDDFVNKCLNKDPNFQNNYPCEWMLLKSMDRAFWVRHLKDKNEKKYKPGEHKHKCPFGDPSIGVIGSAGVAQGLVSVIQSPTKGLFSSS